MLNRQIIFAAMLSVLVFLSEAQAVNPAPNGCYPNFTTAEGCNALNALTTGQRNTAVGWQSLFSTTTASVNTGVGAGALALNKADNINSDWKGTSNMVCRRGGRTVGGVRQER